MNIVVLDGYTLNPGDLSWDGLGQLGSCEIFDRTSADAVIERAQSAEIILTNKVVLNREILQALPRLRYIGVLATGFNVVDIEQARAQNITVTNVPGYSTPSVAQAVFALLLELTNRVGHHNDLVHRDHWIKSVDFCFWDGQLIELAGLTMGIVGFGATGRAVTDIAKAFQMEVLVHSRTQYQLDHVRFVDRSELFSQADVVSLHCPLTEGTENLINKTTLALMKPSAFLINTGRGGLINEADLANALSHGQIAGAGIDVTSTEPPLASNPLLKAKNCVITPHIAWATIAARKRLMEIVVGNIRHFLKGQAANVVS